MAPPSALASPKLISISFAFFFYVSLPLLGLRRWPSLWRHLPHKETLTLWGYQSAVLGPGDEIMMRIEGKLQSSWLWSLSLSLCLSLYPPLPTTPCFPDSPKSAALSLVPMSVQIMRSEGSKMVSAMSFAVG